MSKKGSNSSFILPPSSLPEQSRMILYRTEDGRTRIEVRLQEESVWLNQSAMAELFQSSKQNISLHLKNIFNEGELEENRVVKEYLTTGADGKNGCCKCYHTMEALVLRGKP